MSGEARDDPFAPLRELLEPPFFIDFDERVALRRLLSEHDSMSSHLMACTATCKPATGDADG